MHADVTTETNALEAVREGGAVLDESISGFLEDGRVPPYRLHIVKEKPERRVHEGGARRWFRDRRENGGVPGEMAPFNRDAAVRALSDVFLHASPGAKAVFGQDGVEGLDPEGGRLWLLKNRSGRKRVLGEDGWKDGEEAFWLDAEILWTFAPKAVDAAVRRALDCGLAVYDPQEDKLYRRVQASCRDVRWRCHAMAEELCALARRTSPFVDRIVLIEEMESGRNSASASYTVVIRGGDGAGTLRKRLRAFCRDFEAELERAANGGTTPKGWKPLGPGPFDSRILHCGRSLAFAAGAGFTVSFSIEGYSGDDALTVHMDNRQAPFDSETCSPGPLSVEPLGRPRIADLLQEARELAGERGLLSNVFLRLHTQRMAMRRPGMADRLAYSVEVEKRLRDLNVFWWSSWEGRWSSAVSICDRTSLFEMRPDEDCLHFEEESLGFLYPSLKKGLPCGIEIYSFLNPFTVRAGRRIAEDMKKWRDCLANGTQTPELLEHLRCCRFERLDPDFPWNAPDERLLEFFFSQKNRLLWLYDFLIEWFEEFPEDAQDRCYNIVGL